ncbi:hypothetical protein [Gallaecimonas sp. GXIMD1310]|uniref:hypothetical protein n=1 Tax=Gallaecimonas sp. GXIMD1310 TaxID=3131926 RepID=UPI00324B9959
MQEDDLYIRALKFAEQKQVFKFNELMDELQIDGKLELVESIRRQIAYGQLFYQSQTPRHFLSGQYETVDIYFTVNDKFRLLEYTELKEARASSLKASQQAKWALIISSILAATSIGVSLIGLLK